MFALSDALRDQREISTSRVIAASSMSTMTDLYANVDIVSTSSDFGKARATLSTSLCSENSSSVMGMLAFQIGEFYAFSPSSVSATGRNGVGNIFAGTLRVTSVNAAGAHGTATSVRRRGCVVPCGSARYSSITTVVRL